MKTYAETQGKEIFNWNEFLSRDPQTITDDEWHRAGIFGSNWPTCAVGHQCDIIPRLKNGIPIDSELLTYGILFSRHIGSRNLGKSKQYFDLIELRSAELIAAN